MGRLRIDPFAVAASVLAGVMLFVYLSVIRQQDGDPAGWFVAALAVGAAAAGCGAVRGWPHRRASLVLAGLVLLPLGLLAILSIGLPVLLAGVLSLVAAGRATAAPPAPAAG
jgi:hypothetical protein